MIGKTLGHYQIAAQLGKGGMGEVYRARDTKLNREVALKVLPEEFAGDLERMARFKREAQLLASLNHTNIASIYGLEESGDARALVMELVEGPTLADRISKGLIPLDEALPIAGQIAEALEAAHEKGIIHRDLKPSNIKVTKEGAVKVLDFGLAKAMEGEAAAIDASQSPTLSLAATKAGVILGTAAYMSPEQARGAAVDKRCDIWSFGVVLFEMLTGKQLFAGETISDTLAAVLRADIDWNLLPANTPASIRTLLRRCLAKDRRQRLQAIGESRILIEEYLANPAAASAAEAVAIPTFQRFRERFAWGALTLLVVALAALGVVYYRKTTEPRQVTRLEYNLPEDQQFSDGGYMFLAVSPDGRRFSYSTNKGLFVRSLDEWDAKRVVEANENPSNPVFSPDGQWVAYRSMTENKLKKVLVGGGVPIPLCDVGGSSGAFWGADDTIIWGDYGRGLMRISANGGNPEGLITDDAKLYFHPQFLPDQKLMLFTLSPMPYRIAARLPGSTESKLLISKGDRSRYLPTGHLVYGLENNLCAVSFDPAKLTLGSGSVAVVGGIYRAGRGAPPQYDISSSGTLVYAHRSTTDNSSNRTLVWVSRNGKEEPIEAPPKDYGETSWSAPRISPDGSQIAFAATAAGNADIWILDLVRKNLNKITHDEGDETWPLWTSDSKQIVYWSSPAFNPSTVYLSSIYRRPADGSGDAVKLGSLSDEYPTGLFSWVVPEEKILACLLVSPPVRLNIVTISIKGGISKELLLEGNAYAQHPQISPDKRWMAYASNETGQNQVYVCPFPEVNKSKKMVSTNGGYGPLWSPDGRELFYRNGESVVAVAVETAPDFKAGNPHELFKGKYYSSDLLEAKYPNWDIHPKDKRFLMIKEGESTSSTVGGARKINVVLNWFEELKQRVPVK